MTTTPDGLALYQRKILKSHGAPKEYARRMVEMGMRWMALAGVWQDEHNGKVTSRWMNKADDIKRYAEELMSVGIQVYIWGYPWMGEEERFVEQMTSVMPINAQLGSRILLDPELGSNPDRASKGAGKKKANAHAAKLVKLFGQYDQGVERIEVLGLSTYGSGWRMKWFPLLAFTKALIEYFGGRTFIGGQTYTEDGLVDRSIGDMIKVIEKAGGVVRVPGSYRGADAADRSVEVVPNFGTYSWIKKDPSKPLKGSNRKARAKTPEELAHHLLEFVNEEEPVDAMIGWAENFVTKAQEEELRKFARLIERGACRL